jgi:CBS domain-containing protein
MSPHRRKAEGAGGAAVADMSRPVRDIMVRKVKTLDRNDTLDAADDLMTMERIRHIPVLDGTQLTGVVSQRDLFRSALATALGYGEKGRRTVMHTFRVKDVMSEPPITVGPDVPIREAARLMLEHRFGCLPVVESGRLVGLVTETDILRYAIGG